MILISTLRKMIQKDPNAQVARVVIKAFYATLPDGSQLEFKGTTDYFVTDRQANDAVIRNAETIKAMGGNPALLNYMDYVPANEAAKAQGFDFLGA